MATIGAKLVLVFCTFDILIVFAGNADAEGKVNILSQYGVVT